MSNDTIRNEEHKYEFDAFISYSHKDLTIVRVLAKRLEQHGIKIWIDYRNNPAGNIIYDDICKSSEKCRHIIAFYSNEYKNSEWASFEPFLSTSNNPKNRQGRLIFFVLDDTEIPDHYKVYKYINFNERDESAFNELISRIMNKDVPTHDPTWGPADPAPKEATFPDLLKKSYGYVLDRTDSKRSASSRTTMYFYGLNFDDVNPRLIHASAIQAIITELMHLQSVLTGGEHNPGKAEGLPQIADEIVDMFRHLFILGIMHGHGWEDIPWYENFRFGYSQCQSPANSSFYFSCMRSNYKTLVNQFTKEDVPGERIKKWIKRQLYDLGGFAKACGVPIELLREDLQARLSEDKQNPTSTAQYERHTYIKTGKYFICHFFFFDKTGSYRKILEKIWAGSVDIWASTSSTVVFGETAEATMLLALNSNIPESGNCCERRVDEILGDLLFFDSTATGILKRPIIISRRIVLEKEISAKSEGDYLAIMSNALKEFKIEASKNI